jgi:hypothetical protein
MLPARQVCDSEREGESCGQPKTQQRWGTKGSVTGCPAPEDCRKPESRSTLHRSHAGRGSRRAAATPACGVRGRYLSRGEPWPSITNAMLHVELAQCQRFTPTRRAFQHLPAPSRRVAIAGFPHSNYSPFGHCLKIKLHGRRVVRLIWRPLKDKAPGPLRLQYGASILTSDPIRAPFPPLEPNLSLRSRIDMGATREPTVESVRSGKRVVHALGNSPYEDVVSNSGSHLERQPQSAHSSERESTGRCYRYRSLDPATLQKPR